ncbi:hypothetical protein [Bradyrhizobium sp.]|uniref:hypothetical protein n=1 Tax=Bradyrhizobium sp. TaxID=376 RepID=UPI002C364214|nr:hypothetical protein [Bradyrhizobium sp.]HMM93036.1 hypothetical protein [Bradyrhizobium sp.]
MHGDIPSAIRPLERSDRGLSFKENFSQGIDDALGYMLIADSELDTVCGGGGVH